MVGNEWLEFGVEFGESYYLIHYRNDSINEYYARLRSVNKDRKFAKILAKLLVGKSKWR